MSTLLSTLASGAGESLHTHECVITKSRGTPKKRVTKVVTHIYDMDESRESDMHMNSSHYALDEHMCEHIRV